MPLDIIDREFRYCQHEDSLNSRLVMSTNIRTAILERNQELQRNPGALNDLTFGRMALSIPVLDNHYLVKKYPDLQSDDGPTKQRALAKFMASTESIPYRVRA
jgi:hypothetical protein